MEKLGISDAIMEERKHNQCSHLTEAGGASVSLKNTIYHIHTFGDGDDQGPKKGNVVIKTGERV